MPSKSLRMMKFTTPAIASEPYTDEAPTVSTSMRSTAEAGIALTSAPPSGRSSRVTEVTTAWHSLGAGRLNTIDIFPWDDNFNTGLAVVDAQHRKLVELLNALATQVA